jgi:predicted enzyme related to lactoylglutathione lyase
VPTQATPLVSRINVVYLYVRDVGRSAAFYRDLLGIPLEGDAHWMEARLGDARFALHEAHEGIGELGAGTIHLNFEVGALDAALEALREAGVEVRDAMSDEWGSAAEVVDPDGYRIFLFEPPRP